MLWSFYREHCSRLREGELKRLSDSIEKRLIFVEAKMAAKKEEEGERRGGGVWGGPHPQQMMPYPQHLMQQMWGGGGESGETALGD